MATGRPVYLRYNYYQHITYTGKRSLWTADFDHNVFRYSIKSLS